MDETGQVVGHVGVPYPEEWEADVVLRDGTTTHLRPIRPDDADALQRFQMAQSERSTYFRFFAALERLPERMLRQFVTVDHQRRAAIVAVRPAQAQAPVEAAGAEPEDVLGVARYDVVEDGTAEVAFNIADSFQGRGLGSVLLEHIAAAARERGVRRFVAEVLPQNRAMLAVFRDAGYVVDQHLDDGVVTVSIDLDPTDRSREVMADREHRAEARSMQGLLSARRVLLVGPGPGPQTVESLLAARVVGSVSQDPGDTDLVVLGAPDAGEPGPADHVTFADGWDEVGDVDLALLALRPPEAIEAVRNLAGRGTRGVVVLSAGYAEEGPEGLARQRELLRVAHAAGMRVVGPASFGLLTTTPGAQLRASLATSAPAPGTIGLFCQSAPAAVTLAATVRRRGLGVSALVSAGHRADVSGNDLMQYWQDDPATGVVCLYLESLGNPRKFSRIARRLATVKPVVVVVAGRSGHVVPPGHAVRATRAPRRMLDEVLRQSGVIRAENTHQLMDVAQVLAHQPLPAGARVGILASSPSVLTLVSEACSAAGLTVGPAVVLASESPDVDVAGAVDAVYAPGACDAVVVVDVPVVLPRGDRIAHAVADAAARTGRTTVASMLGLHGMPDELAATAPLPDGGERTVRIPAFSTPEDAVWALGAVTRYATWRTQDHGAPVRPTLQEGAPRSRGPREDPQRSEDASWGGGGASRARARALAEAALARAGLVETAGHGAPGRADGAVGHEVELDPAAAAELLACYGLRLWETRRVNGADEAVAAAEELGWPVALKIASPVLRHRTDLGGVRLDISDADELRDDVARMEEAASTLIPTARPVLEVQRMAPAGVACVVRSVEDELFGPVVSFGLAGDAVDLLDDVSHGVPPLTDVDVARMVRGVRAAPRLFGYQGAPAADVAALEDVLARVSLLADDLPELASLDLYPVVVSDRDASILHATVRLRPAERRTDALLRALPG
ncbi:GNAT family N-acetyltransferase [Antribacter gilvus]|uniref:GNAT family N-acetyltransferase n=1 Tax=Antribacter gilvus TaxID=2304675 RepID=UPI001F0BDCC9|nr:GNAT family N-acetyltransferase [Antribacter gilvus]